MPETLPGSMQARKAFTMRFACDAPPEEGGPPTHKHTGATYVLTPPKMALSMKWSLKINAGDPAKVAALIDNWMRKAFGAEVAADLHRRIYGPDEEDENGDPLLSSGVVDQDGNPVDEDDDPLDIPDIMEAIKYCGERAAGVPPT